PSRPIPRTARVLVGVVVMLLSPMVFVEPEMARWVSSLVYTKLYMDRVLSIVGFPTQGLRATL
ncbi:MAG: hypothetical protein AAFS10_26090, partial [Myxococcota bacterium]